MTPEAVFLRWRVEKSWTHFRDNLIWLCEGAAWLERWFFYHPTFLHSCCPQMAIGHHGRRPVAPGRRLP
jgi:hypothetical protein